MPGQVRATDPKSQVVRLSTDAPAPDSLDSKVSQIFSTVTILIGIYEFIHNTLRTRFRNLVEIPEAVTVIYDNDPEDPPEDTIWVRFIVEHLNQQTTTTGGDNQVHRKNGLAKVMLMGPLEDGDRDLLRLADAVDAAFLDQTETLIYGTTSMDVLGRQNDGRWWVLEVSAPWRHDELTALNPAGGGFQLPDFEALHNAVRTRFQTEIEVPESVIVIYDNSPIDPPEDTIFIRMAVRPGLTFRAENGGTAGQNRFRTPGVLMATVLAPLEAGDRDSLRLVDAINVAFRAITVSGVTYQTPRVTNRGRDADGRWWQIAVTCPFYSDEIA